MLRPPQDWPIRVALLSGGESVERALSLASGAAVEMALRTSGHQVERLDPRDELLSSIDWSRFDAVFLALHGGAGEDGRVQQELADLGVSYTGSGPSACRLAMCKSAAKDRFRQTRVPTLPYELLDIDHPLEDFAHRVRRLGYPVVVKPDHQGNSRGVSFVASEAELRRGVAAAAAFDGLALAEPWIDGREFTVAVLGREPLPLVEILTPRGLVDFDAQHHDPATSCRFETGLPTTEVVRLQSVAVAAAAALETHGLVLVDLLVDRAGHPWVLEVNTTPGMTATGFAPQAAARSGFDLPALCDWMLRDCLRAEVLT